jgi:glutamine synthetase adenylyltransferase
MVGLPEDLTLDLVEHLLGEAEEHRIEQVVLIEHLTGQAQSTAEAEHILTEIEAIIDALHCRCAYLQAMQENP